MTTSSTHPLVAWELAEASASGPAWRSIGAPATVAKALLGRGEDVPLDLDARGWLYRCRFPRPPAGATELRLPPLATLAEVRLNGALILASQNAFVSHTLDVGARLSDDNLLELAFRPLTQELQRRRPRPRWKTRLTPHQQLRWLRTPLYGRMPGWTPPWPPVGPLGPVAIARPAPVVFERLAPRVEGDWGIVEVALRGAGPITLRVGDAEVALIGSETSLIRGELRLPRPERWWPHTHGRPTRYPVHVTAGGQKLVMPALGFRTIEVDRGSDGAGFGLVVNGVPVFARGASWMPPDAPGYRSDDGELRSALAQLVAAGMNMVRLSGTIGYEAPIFHTLCDELGLLVWQDFAFANLDYPAGDPELVAEVRSEAEPLLRRLASSPSLAVLCGNSEVEQQVAMLGLDAPLLHSPLFHELLPALAAEHCPGVPYLSSTPTGGARPFVVDEGIGHYYGVGAYLRPLADARTANVRFAAECLALSNVPEPATVEALLGPGETAPHHPRWKERVSRDVGSGWDFEDVRDHYVGQLFDIDVLALRYRDPERYLELGRVASGEVIGRTLAEWRRQGSSCKGALVWFLRDLWPGAGLGIVDALGRPKAAYHYARRALSPVAVLLSDEGVNGVRGQIVNDLDHPVHGTLRLVVGRRPAAIVAEATLAVDCPARGAQRFDVEAALGRFYDLNHAYRFGPATADLVVADLYLADKWTQRAALERLPWPATLDGERGLSVTAQRADRGLVEAAVDVTITASRWRTGVVVRAGDFDSDDNYVTIAPGEARTLRLTARYPGARLRGEVASIDEVHPLSLELTP